MIEIAMLPSIVRETAVVIRSRHPPPAIGAARDRGGVSTAPMSRGQVDHEEERQEDRGHEGEHEAEAETMTPRRPPRAPAMPCATSLTFACAVSGAELCWSTHEPKSELVRMSCTSDGSASTKSLNSEAIGATSSSDHDHGDGDETEHEDRRAGAPAELQLALHEADDRLEHEGDEEREEDRHHRLSDVDERPREPDDDEHEEDRPDRDRDAHGPWRPGLGRLWQTHL